jgi:Icc-related predicted phosphoesterase
MKLALISDLHGNRKTLGYLESICQDYNVDGVIISGDISSRGETEFLGDLFSILIRRKVSGYMICGNADEGAARKMIDESEFSINQSCTQPLMICGICDHEEAPSANLSLAGNIFVSHRPPLQSFLKEKLANAPKFHICGHLHTREIAKQYPSTMLIQVPTLQNRRFAIFDPENKSVRFNSI